MGDTLHKTGISDTIPKGKPSSETNPKGRAFVERWILPRGNSPLRSGQRNGASKDADRLSKADKPSKIAHEMLLATVQAVDRLLVKADPKIDYAKKYASSLTPTVAETGKFEEILKALTEMAREARDRLAFQADSEARARGREQVQAQGQLYEAMGEPMGAVKRTYLAEGGAERVGKATPKSREAEFQRVLRAVASLEQIKKSYVKLRAPTPTAQAAAVKQQCATVIAACQAYLGHVDALGANATSDQGTKAKQAETFMTQARHLSLAMDYDELPAPSAQAPWDDEQQIRAANIRAAMAFETGGKKAVSTSGGGASTSYWVQEASLDQIGREQVGGAQPNKEGLLRVAIFKPTEGEKAPDGTTPVQGAGAIKEALASANAKLFAKQTGIDLRVPDTSVVSIAQAAIERGDPSKAPAIGSAQMLANASGELRDASEDARAELPKDDVHRLALLDIVLLNVDRHPGNVMLDTSDPDKPRMVPIDHGGSLPNRHDVSPAMQLFGGIAGVKTTKVQNAVLKIPSAYEMFDPLMQAQIARLDPDAMEQGMKDHCAALDRVHPDLKTKEKIGADSLHMSKRSMMFLKLAAPKLSPAEIQIAIAAHGPELFDAANQDFDAVAREIIRNQQPKKAAYQSVMLMLDEEREDVTTWLERNDWFISHENGDQSGADFLMRDPVNALKLYNNGKANLNPIVVARAAKPNPQPANDVPDQTTKQQIEDTGMLKGKGKMNDDRWKQTAGIWQEIQTVGGWQAYQDALAATSAQSVNTLPHVLMTVLAWKEINNSTNAAARAMVTASPTTAEVLTVLTTALTAQRAKAANAKTLAAAKTEGDLVNALAATQAAINRLATSIEKKLKEFTDPAKAEPFRRRTDAAKALAEDAGGPNPAETDLRVIVNEVNAALLAEAKTLFGQLADDVMQLIPMRKYPPDVAREKDINEIKESREQVRKLELPAFVKDFTESLRSIGTRINGYDAVANPRLPQPTPGFAQKLVVSDTRDEEEDESEFDDASADSDTNDDDRGGGIAAALSTFDWTESGARAAVQEAVRQKLFKKQKTGLGEQIRLVKAVRKPVDEIRPNTARDKALARLEKLEAAYNRFGIFVASRLRTLSSDPQWTHFCGLAVDAVELKLTDTRAKMNTPVRLAGKRAAMEPG